MPFLRAALIRKNLQPEAERVKAVLPPAAEETQEPEEEFTPTQIDDLHRIIDARTKEAERAEEVIDVEPVQEPTEESKPAGSESEHEAVIETAPEIAEPQTELAQETSQPESSQEVTAENITPEQQQEAVTESIVPESEQQQEISHEVATESFAPETEQETEIITETLAPESEQQQEISQEAVTESIAPESEQAAEIITETVAPQAEQQQEFSQEDITETLAPEAENETVTPESEAQEQEISEAESEAEAVILPEDSNTAGTDFDENLLLDESAQNETPNLEAETVTETPETEQEIITPESDTESSQGDSQPAKPHKDYSGSQLNYDFTSGERYVDKVSTKTEFDKMLDELAAISKELLSWQTEKFARDFTGKFSEGESSQAEARKYEAFLGGYITNAAMILYDKGYRDTAIKQLEQAKSILDARKKLEDETSAIKSRVEEQNDSVDLSDILGLFGDG